MGVVTLIEKVAKGSAVVSPMPFGFDGSGYLRGISFRRCRP